MHIEATLTQKSRLATSASIGSSDDMAIQERLGIVILVHISWTYSGQGTSDSTKSPSIYNIPVARWNHRYVHVGQKAASSATTCTPCPDASWQAPSGRDWRRRSRSNSVPRLEIFHESGLQTLEVRILTYWSRVSVDNSAR